jgi:hypothetical protein
MDIPHEWESEDAEAQKWDEGYNNKTQTEYCANMILVSNEYHNRKHVNSASKQELMYDHQLRKKTLSGQPDHQSKTWSISAYWDIGSTKAHCLLNSGCEGTIMSPNFMCTAKL